MEEEMTHDEYLSRVESFTDSPEDVAAVLAHAGSCAACRREERVVEKSLARLDPKRRSLTEEIAHWSAAAAVLALVVLGFQKEAREAGGSPRSGSAARYVVVGDASGVVAYTPEGVVVGVVAQSASPEKERNK
jgi:hypothetical protein